MNYSEKRKIIENRIFSLQDEVKVILNLDQDVDRFLDNTILLDEWEEMIPDPEYGIFVIAVLNNIRKKTVIDTIVDSILKIDTAAKKKISKSKRQTEQHPFC